MFRSEEAEMEPGQEEEAGKLFGRGLDALSAGEIPSALALLERALKLNDNRSWYSYLGYCMAKERGQVKKGIELCSLSLEQEPEKADHYLQLAKIHLLAGNKQETLRVLREGMARGENQGLIALLDAIGTRKPPVLSFLPRENPVNRLLGICLERLRLR
jgi:tetratricopeptide (TPR) repeat protein